MGSFGALPYFLTVLLQDVMNFTPLQTGLAFLVPSAAIFVGTQAGSTLTTRLGARWALVIGAALGALGTALWATQAIETASLLSMTLGIVISGLGQGIVWTAMWAAVGAGVADQEQGIASGIGSTAQNTGNAIGLAVFVAISAGFAADGSGKAAVADGAQAALWAIAGALLLIVLVALFLRAARRSVESETLASRDGG
jgi:MFS family permease